MRYLNLASFLIIFMLISSFVWADDWKDDVFYGGSANVSVNFGEGGETVLGISPLAGYKVTNWFHPGISTTFLYYHRRAYRNFPSFTTTIYGGGPFARFLITDRLFAMAQYDLLNVGYQETAGGEIRRGWVQGMLIGGGYLFPLGGRGNAELVVLFNVLDEGGEPAYPYPNPIVRFGISF